MIQRLFTAALLVVWSLLGWSPARAADEAFPEPGARLFRAVEQARGPLAVTELRGLWDAWDRLDPEQIEAALDAAGASERLGPGPRSYARLLAAYARLRRGDTSAAAREVEALGFVTDWIVVGPFDNEGGEGHGRALGPEAEAPGPIVPGRAYGGKLRPVRPRRLPPGAFRYGFVDGTSLLRPDRKICLVATTFVAARPGRPPGDLLAWVGVGGTWKLHWDGEELAADGGERRYDADRRVVRLPFGPGTHRLLLKVCTEDVAPIFSLRLSDLRGAPDARLDVSADPARSAEPLPARGPGVRPRPASPIEGPLDLVEREALAAGARLPAIDAAARYLSATGGDDRARHLARDLALRAADLSPSVERLLRAARLAEDRNGVARLIERAEALASAGDADPDLLLARAEHLRGGPDPRSAYPLYERVLRLRPDDVDALRGIVEQLDDAGLRRSALVVLERAASASPRSVLILGMLASELRALGRVSEARGVEARYSALRFDDRTVLGRRAELAALRGNPLAASHHVERLLAAEPDGQWAREVAARTYRALGRPDRAIAELDAALALAPEDVGTLRALADLRGERGDRGEQLALLGRVRELTPGDAELREYLRVLEPSGARPDEAFALGKERFLPLAGAPRGGQSQRTLVDLTVTTVFESGLSSRFRQIVFQPLTEAAAAAGRQYVFQYQADSERVQLRGARVFRADGRVDEATESGEGAADDPSIAMYTSARTFYVQLPRLEPGDVVELRYRVDPTTSVNAFGDYFGEIVPLQGGEPIAHAEYVVLTPRARRVHFDVARVPGVRRESSESGEHRVHRFVAEQVPAVAPEPHMPPWSAVVGFVHASTYESWDELGRWYWGLVRDQLDLDDETRRLAREVARGARTDQERVRAVYDWVVTNTRYVALEFGIFGYKPRRCVQTVTRGWGDCKDKAAVIVTLLRELGIDAELVLVRTGLRGEFASKLPSLAPFDHAIAYVPSLDLYLDGTAEGAGSTELPAMDQGSLALRVSARGVTPVRLPVAEAAKNHRRREVHAALRADGAALVEAAIEARGSRAAAFRKRFHAESTRRDRVTALLAESLPGFELGPGASAVALPTLDLEAPFVLRATGTARRLARVAEGTLSLAVTPQARLAASFASLSTRRLPLELPGPSTDEETFVVKLPAGARIVSAPVAAAGTSPFGRFAVEVEQSAGSITVRSTLALAARQVEPAEYEAFRRFAAEADAAFTPRLVVEVRP